MVGTEFFQVLLNAFYQIIAKLVVLTLEVPIRRIQNKLDPWLWFKSQVDYDEKQKNLLFDLFLQLHLMDLD